MNDYITTTKQSTTKPCAYFLGYTVCVYIHIFHITAPGTYAYKDLLVDAQPSAQQLLNLAQATKRQSGSALWNAHRKGRITASNCYRIINAKQPGQSALRAIMQYDTYDLSKVPAVKWGIDHESQAKAAFIEYMEKEHDEFISEDIGLVLCHDFPFLAASPDGVAKCSCHGISMVEIKCPYKYRFSSPTDEQALTDRNYCLNENGLKSNHKYYCQVQTQLLVTNSEICHFVVWTPVAFAVMQVRRDQKYIDTILEKAQQFVKLHLVPELISQKLKFASEDDECFTDGKQLCSCGKPGYGKMIACYNDDCTVDKFHYACVNIKRKPRGPWFCPECKNQNNPPES